MKDNLNIVQKIDLLLDLKNKIKINPSFVNSNEFINLSFMKEADLNKINNSLSSLNGNCVYFTSGTTGKPKAIYYTKADINFAKKYISWMCKIEGIPKGSTVAVLMDQSFWGVGYFTCLGHVTYGNKVIPIDTDLPNKNIKEIIQTVNPSVISSIPSILLDKSKDLLGLNFDFIETTGELLTAEQRCHIENHYSGTVFDAYGLTESIIGVECKAHDGYHYNDKEIFLEIVAPDGKRLPDNTFGEVVLTILINDARSLIRYKTGDRGKILHTICACGVLYPKVYISGRLEKTYFLYEGYKLEHKDIQRLLNEVYGRDIKFLVKLKNHGGIHMLLIKIEDGDENKNKVFISKLQKLNFEMMHMVRNNKVIIKII